MKRSPHRAIFNPDAKRGHAFAGAQLGALPVETISALVFRFLLDTDPDLFPSSIVRYGTDYIVTVSPLSDALHVIDITDRLNPSVVGSLVDGTNLNNATELVVIGDVAVVTGISSGSGRVATVDLSTPSSPAILDSLSHADYDGMHGIAAIDASSVIVCCANVDRVVTFDVSTPSAIAELDRFTNGTYLNSAWDVVVDTAEAVAITITNETSGTGFAAKLDVSDPSNISAIAAQGSSDFEGARSIILDLRVDPSFPAGRRFWVPRHVTSSDGHVTVGDHSGTPGPIDTIGDATTMEGVEKAVLYRNHIIAACTDYDGLTSVDASDPYASSPPYMLQLGPTLQDHTNLDRAQSIVMIDQYAMVGMVDGLAVVEVIP